MKKEELLNELRGNVDAVLGGSRSAAQADPTAGIHITEDTDWDFNMQFSKKNIDYLEELGFEYKGVKDQYKDISCAAIFKHYEHNVDIVLRKNLDKYLSVWRQISPTFFKIFIWKSDPDKKLDKKNHSFYIHLDNVMMLFNSLLRIDQQPLWLNQKTEKFYDEYLGYEDEIPF